jgi:hypothetical protein
MKTTPFLWGMAGLCALLISGCSSEEGSEEPQIPVTPEVEETTVSFMPELRSMTRATETAFETGDEISVYAVKKEYDGQTVSLDLSRETPMKNVKYTYNGSLFASDQGMSIAKNGEDQYAYFAMYPYTSTAAATYKFSVRNDQSSAANYTKSDLCTASTSFTEEPTPTLSFMHRLSNLVLVLDGDNLSGNVSVKLTNVATEASCNVNSLTFAATGTTGNVLCNEYGTNTYRAVIVPQTIAEGTAFATVTINGKEYIVKTLEDVVLASGRQVTLSVHITEEAVVVFTGDISAWNTVVIENAIPYDILEKMDDHIEIYRGNNPPNLEGCFLFHPAICLYCEDEDNGGYAPGEQVSSMYLLFENQDTKAQTIEYSELSASYKSYSLGNGAYIIGENNNFTVFFNLTGYSQEEDYVVYLKEAMVISGTKTSSGIENLKYAFVMVEKSDDPNNYIMEEGVYRVFYDGDYVSQPTDWPSDFTPYSKARRRFGINAMRLNCQYLAK